MLVGSLASWSLLAISIAGDLPNAPPPDDYDYSPYEGFFPLHLPVLSFVLLPFEKIQSEVSLDLDNIPNVMGALRAGMILPENMLLQLLNDVKIIFEAESTVMDVSIPEGHTLTICGDIHGQLEDLLRIFDENGLPNESHTYVFNGDLVDRGPQSIAVITLLFYFKTLYPANLYIIRGNHETLSVNAYYGFRTEVLINYNEQMHIVLNAVFDYLPIIFIIQQKIMVMHGGLPEDASEFHLDNFRQLDRKMAIFPESALYDLLWSDPMDGEGQDVSPRGAGILFGPDVTGEFLDRHGMDLIVRSHQCVTGGYEFMHDDRLVTLFSAPHYYGKMSNLGAYLNLDNNLKREFRQFH